jgi:HNH endonuclease
VTSAADGLRLSGISPAGTRPDFVVGAITVARCPKRPRPRPPDSLTVELVDGRVIHMGRLRRPGPEYQIQAGARIAERYFDACPICGDPATHNEHVPPRSLGGRVMTRTCGPCNNQLDSKVEADLVDWYDDAVTFPAFSGDAVQGARRATRIFYRADIDGTPGLLMDESADRGVRELLLSGKIDLTAYEPDRNRVRLGLLKHAFLAACMACGPLEGPEADAVRADLIAARDAPSRDGVPRSDIALGLTDLRSTGTPRPNDLVLRCIATGADNVELHGVSLAGTWRPTPTEPATRSGVVHP